MSINALIDWRPALQVALAGAAVASGPLAWVALRRHREDAPARWRILATLTLFLTFDLVVFGAFTRLTDSGLGCPDWPGCYGTVSPVSARVPIDAAQQAMPFGPVTTTKAWIEMIHRYLATSVGVLLIVLLFAAWRARRHDPTSAVPLGLPGLALVWVCVQGLFGMLTVTLKLYPAVVSAHLLLALGLLVILTVQSRGLPSHDDPFQDWRVDEAKRHRARTLTLAAALLLFVQIALGAWVSTNYAVLACNDFPRCRGAWWPPMDFASGYTLLRPLGHTAEGGYLSQEALTAIHMGHRLGAVVVLAALLGLASWLWHLDDPWGRARRYGVGLFALALCQLASGLSNVVLGWPMPAALAHTAGAALLCIILSRLWANLHAPRQHRPL